MQKTGSLFSSPSWIKKVVRWIFFVTVLLASILVPGGYFLYEKVLHAPETAIEARAIPRTPGQDVLLLLGWTALMAAGLTYLHRKLFHPNDGNAAKSQQAARFKGLVENSNDIIWETDENFYYTYVSPTVKELLGYQPEDFIGRPLFENPGIPGVRCLTDFDLFEHHQVVRGLEYTNLHQDGTIIIFECSAAPIIGESGQFQGYRGVDRNITKRKLFEEQLRDQQYWLSMLLNAIPDAVYLKDSEGRWLVVNEKGKELFAFDTTMAYHGKNDEEIAALVPRYRDFFYRSSRSDEQAWERDDPYHYEEYLWQLDSSYSVLDVIKVPILNRDRSRKGLVVVIRDITARKKAEEQERLAASVFATSSEGIVITDIYRKIVKVNRSFTDLTGYTPEEVLNKTLAILHSGRHDKAFYDRMWQTMREKGSWEGEIWNRRKNGEIYAEWLKINSVFNEHNQLSYYIGVFTDITEQKLSNERIYHLAYYDSLTDLPNRVLFQEHLQQAIVTARREGHLLAMAVVDLKRFKAVNDAFGQGIGDAILQAMTTRLREQFPNQNNLARLGDDEFALILYPLENRQVAIDTARNILENLNRAVFIENHEIYLSARIGIAIFPHDGTTVDSLIRAAEHAQQQAKRKPGIDYCLYEANVASTGSGKAFELEAALHLAIPRHELCLYYQPQIDVKTGKVTGAEALIRWHHPKLGFVSPGRFIPLAEESELIINIDEWVLRKVCLQIGAWRKANIAIPRIAINLSARHFGHPMLVPMVMQILEETGVAAHELEFEITESAIMSDVDSTINILKQFCDMGIHLAIDDFGTGYSSLNYLKRFPLHTLKIDRSFVQNVPHNTNDSAIVETIIALAHQLKLLTLAEGVETLEQFHFLSERGCDMIQGYLFGTAVPSDDAVHWLKSGHLVPSTPSALSS